MNTSLRSLLILCALVSASTQQDTTNSTTTPGTLDTTNSTTAGTLDTTNSTTTPGTLDITNSTTAGTLDTTNSTTTPGTLDITNSTTAGTLDTTNSTTTPGTLDITNSTTPGTPDTTNSTTPGTPDTTNSTTAGTPDTTNSTTAGTSDTTNSTTAGTLDTTNSTTTPGTSDTTNSTTPGTPDTTNSTTPGTPDTTNSTTAGTSDTTNSTTAGTPDTTNSTTAGTSDTTNSTTAGTSDTTNSTTAGTSDTTNSTTAGTSDTTNSTTAGTSDTTNSTTPGTTAGTPATTTKGPCSPNPCVGNGICEERFGGVFVCLCRSGLVYDDIIGCIPAKVFPGNLVLTDIFKDEMSDKTSSLFNETAERIQKQLQLALQGNGYIGSVVLSLRSGSIVAEVQNFYQVSSNATTQTVEDLIIKAINDGIISNSTFNKIDVCSIGVCDDNTTSCDGDDGIAKCTCKDGYIRSQFTDQVCIACPNGEKAVGSDHCEKCSFGFSGFNCNDPYLLVVVVVSCVLGALLIIFIVALIVVSCRKQKESSLPKDDFSPYGTVEMHKPAGVPRIPRANPNSGAQYEYVEIANSGSTQALVTKTQPEIKTRYTNYDDDDDVRYRNHDSPVVSGVKVMENGLRGVQNPYYRRDEDSMRR